MNECKLLPTGTPNRTRPLHSPLARVIQSLLCSDPGMAVRDSDGFGGGLDSDGFGLIPRILCTETSAFIDRIEWRSVVLPAE